MEKVILVDENDRELGVEDKLKAHRHGGKLHRAFSVFVFNSKGELLIQQRTEKKYHSGGKWSNTCCSHPRVGETLLESARRRLKEEMGIECELKKVFDFIYHEPVGNGFTEWEFDHVFYGKFDGAPSPNKDEVKAWKWVVLKDLKKDMVKRPEKYTVWFRIAIDKALSLQLC